MGAAVWDKKIQPNIGKIVDMAAKGATGKEIAKNLGITYPTLYAYLQKGRDGVEPYSKLATAYDQACNDVDDTVEAALYRRAVGYVATDIRREQKIGRDGKIITLVHKIDRDVPPDPGSAIFWLTNRRPGQWRYKPEPVNNDDDGGGVVLLPNLIDLPAPPGGDKS